MRICNKCLETKPLERFTKNIKYRGGIRPTCKDCHAKYMREYYDTNPEQVDKDRTRERQRQRRKKKTPSYIRHGLTLESYTSIREKFNDKCWSCRDRKSSSIDHDHRCCPGPYSCGACVRGVLCSQCNTALGLLQDSIEYIKGLELYLEEHYERRRQ